MKWTGRTAPRPKPDGLQLGAIKNVRGLGDAMLAATIQREWEHTCLMHGEAVGFQAGGLYAVQRVAAIAKRLGHHVYIDPASEPPLAVIVPDEHAPQEPP